VSRSALFHQDRRQPGIGGAGSEEPVEHPRPQPGVEVVDVGLDHQPVASRGFGERLRHGADDQSHDIGALREVTAAGAADAWLTPILMKKGRPAHTVAALAPIAAADGIRRVLTAETSTIGTRSAAVTKHALERSWITVVVDGQDVRVKIAEQDGRRSNLAPEFDDVAAAAAALGRPVKEVLARATAAALDDLER